MNAVIREYDYLISRAKKQGNEKLAEDLTKAQEKVLDSYTNPAVAPDTSDQ